MEFGISKTVSRMPMINGDPSPLFYLVIGSSKGVSTNWEINVAEKKVLIYDQIVKSKGSMF